MKHFLQYFLRFSFAFIVFISLTINAIAQTGTISGRIVDDQNLALPGATVLLPNLAGKGAFTDEKGEFTIVKVPVGEHDIKVTYIGYEGYTGKITVEANKIAVFKYTLKTSEIIGEAVIVMGDRLKGQAKALNEQRNNLNITNIVAADQIGRFPDANIGDAMKRIPGISVLSDQGEARFGVFRGTEPRFNSVMVNGERVPSAESGSRTVQLDLIPADMIQTIQVNKALTPDLDADAIGGAANLVTRAAPNALRISGTLGSGVNFLTNKPIFLGSLIAGKRFFDNKLGVIVSTSFLDNKFGSDNAEFVWDRNAAGQTFVSNAEIRKYLIQRTRRSGSISLDYKIGTHSTITFRTIYNWRDDWEQRYRATYSGLTAPNATTGLVRGRFEAELKGGGEDQKFGRREKQTTTVNTLSGEHLIANKIKVNWSGTYSYAEEDRPNERYISFRTGTIDMRPNYTNQEFPIVTPATPLNYSTIPFRRLQLRNDFTYEKDLNGQLHVLVPMKTEGSFTNSLKFGLRYRGKEKKFDRNRGELRTATGATPTVRWTDLQTQDYSESDYLANGGGTEYRVGQFPVPETFEGFEQRFNAPNFVPDVLGNAGNSYSAKETITGGYVMLNQNLGTKAFLLAGVRLENTNVTYDATEIRSATNLRPISRSSSYTNVLPSLHFKYDVAENTVLRAAWTNTLARPNYADLAPIRNIDQSNNTISTGNPDLKATTSMNFDFMAEHYFKSVGLISGGVFYKDISNFIYTYSLANFTDPIDGNTYVRATQPRNGSDASLVGFEVAFQRQLDFLPGFLKGFGIYLNYTYNESQVKNFPGRENETIALPGTAKHTWNASLSYETKKLVVRVASNFRGDLIDPDETLIGLASGGEDFRFLDRAFQLDANASYAITPKFRIFAEAINLTNQPLRYYQGVRERTMQAEYYNTRIQFGLKFDLFE
jgi:TonB-dependent receptor